MSILAQGWVEFKGEFGWTTLIDAAPLMDQNYDMFGSLFGVRNHAHFRPIAPERGLPDDGSEPIKRDFALSSEHSFSPTWIAWQEIRAIDWEEETEVEPYRVRVSGTTKDGRRYEHESTSRRAWLAQKLSLSEEALDAAWETSQSWLIDGEEYEAIKSIKRKDALTRGWQTLFKFMETLVHDGRNEAVV